MSSSCNRKCIFGQWAHLASTILQLLTGIQSLLKGTLYTEFSHWLLTRSILLQGTYISVYYLGGIIPIGVFPWLGFPLLTKYGVMSNICAWLLLLFNITCLLCYVWFKVINNIQLVTKVCRLLIHPPLSNSYFYRVVSDLGHRFESPCVTLRGELLD